MKKDKRQFTRLLLVVIAAVMIEFVLSNYSALAMLIGGGEKREIDLGKSVGHISATVTKDEPLYLKNIDTEMKNIMVTLEGNYFEYVDVTVSFTDDNFRFDDAYDYNKATVLMKVDSESRNYIPLSSYGKVGTIKISCDEPINITEVALNVIPELHFGVLRFLFVLTVLLCAAFGLWKPIMSDGDQKYVKICAAVMSLFILVSSGITASLSGDVLLMELPEDVTGQDQYTQLFDAFHDGRLDLAIKYDTQKLDAVGDVYDRSERNENGLHGAFWDRAYYNGKFYSYFGAAPIFTVYYPVWLLTHRIPSPLFASAILCVYCTVFISLLYGLFIKKYCRNVPLALALFGQVSLIFGSSIIAIASEAQFYFIAVLSGIASVSAFLFFIFKAFYSDSFRSRLIFLVLAGISCALTAASRPTMLLYCLIALIPAWEIFKSKREKLSLKLGYAAAVGVPIIVGAILIMMYNYARFDDPLEFGFNYQLTVSKAQANTIKLSMLMPALYHYFFQQPSFNTSFPYIGIAKNGLDSYTRYNYVGRTMGIFTYPVTWGVFLMPFLRFGRDRVKRSIMLAVPALCVVMSFIDMCKAGSHYRYTADILFLFLLISIIAAFDILEMLKKHGERQYRIAYIFIALAMTATVVLGILLVFANEGGTMMYDYAYAGEFYRVLLGL